MSAGMIVVWCGSHEATMWCVVERTRRLSQHAASKQHDNDRFVTSTGRFLKVECTIIVTRVCDVLSQYYTRRLTTVLRCGAGRGCSSARCMPRAPLIMNMIAARAAHGRTGREAVTRVWLTERHWDVGPDT